MGFFLRNSRILLYCICVFHEWTSCEKRHFSVYVRKQSRGCCASELNGNILVQLHDDVIKWKHFPRYWPFVRRIPITKDSDAELWCFHWSDRHTDDLRCHRAHYDVTVIRNWTTWHTHTSVFWQIGAHFLWSYRRPPGKLLKVSFRLNCRSNLPHTIIFVTF